MRFESLIGQNETAHKLAEMVMHNRLSHAMLFLAKEGSGGLSLARAFAQYIVCEKVNGKNSAGSSQIQATSLFDEPESERTEPVFYTDSCGECPPCLKAAELIHPDIHFSFPVITHKTGEKPISNDFIVEWRQFLKLHPYGNVFDWLQFIGAENKQGNITARECEVILKTMSLKSFESQYKILIMWMPEMLGKEGNKLLKLIEEPPPDTIFILVAENDALILPTILSRTQLIKVPQLKIEDVAAALAMREGLSSEKAAQIASISGGNYHEALQLTQDATDDWDVQLTNWLTTIVRGGPAAQVKWIDEISKIGREKQKQFLKYFTHLLHHAVRIRTMGIELAAVRETHTVNDLAIRLNKLCTVSQQEAIVKELDNAAYFVERNANAKILFHALTIRMYHIISNKSVILVN